MDTFFCMGGRHTSVCICVKARGQPQGHPSGTVFLVLGVGIGLVWFGLLWNLLFVVLREGLTGPGKSRVRTSRFICFPSLDQISRVFSLSLYTLKTVCTSFHMTGSCFLGWMYSDPVPFFKVTCCRRITDSRPALNEHRKFRASLKYIVSSTKKLKGEGPDLLRIYFSDLFKGYKIFPIPETVFLVVSACTCPVNCSS